MKMMTIQANRRLGVSGLRAGIAACGLVVALAATAETPNEDQGKTFRDGWREGRLEAAYLLSPHLNNFRLDADVRGNQVVLRGQVSEGIDAELAEAIAQGMDGIETVDNRIKVVAGEWSRDEPGGGETKAAGERTFGQVVRDATVTARIKSGYFINDHLKGMDLNVDTRNGRVTLMGKVTSEAQKELARRLAANTENVVEVVNEIEVVEDDGPQEDAPSLPGAG
jgi:osmotically-inducible protein OsmY